MRRGERQGHPPASTRTITAAPAALGSRRGLRSRRHGLRVRPGRPGGVLDAAVGPVAGGRLSAVCLVSMPKGDRRALLTSSTSEAMSRTRWSVRVVAALRRCSSAWSACAMIGRGRAPRGLQRGLGLAAQRIHPAAHRAQLAFEPHADDRRRRRGAIAPVARRLPVARQHLHERQVEISHQSSSWSSAAFSVAWATASTLGRAVRLPCRPPSPGRVRPAQPSD
jgi:hypothetical protein